MNTFTTRNLLSAALPHKGIAVFVLLLLVLSALLSLISPWLAGQVTAVILGEEKSYPIVWLIAGWVLLLVSRAGLDISAWYRVAAESENACASLRSLVYEHCHDLPVSFFHETPPGNLLSYFSNDIEVIGRFIVEDVLTALPSILILVGAIAMMWQISPFITLIILVLMPLYYLVLKVAGRKLRPVSGQWMQAYADLMSLIEQRLTNITLLKIFSTRRQESQLFQELDAPYVKLAKKQQLIQSAMTPAMSALSGIGVVIVLGLGTLEIQQGTLTPPNLVTLVLYAHVMTQPLSTFAGLYGSVQSTLGASERILNLLNTDTESDEGERLAFRTGGVKFNHLSFAYNKPLLEDISLDIAPGEIIALTGANGSGKTTLACLLMGLIRPKPGQVYIDDQDLANVSLTSLRANISLITQHTLLLNDTIAENISLNRGGKYMGESDPDRIKKAASASGASAFIESLPDSYETIVGNQGIMLSGGQRQKIALARAMYKDAPLLILDEPTSMFDLESEQAFAEACRNLIHGRTALLITHSPALLALADRVVELDHGKIRSAA
jgi:ABC-type multidrug transport system fused ATPase/permease subunit